MSKKVLDRLKKELGDTILETSNFRGDDTAWVAPKDWVKVATFLRDDANLQMDHFIDLTAVDYPEREPDDARFDVLLSVRSAGKNHRLRLKTKVEAGADLATLTGVWAGADWAEREVYDMFGIKFSDHPDLRRILLYEEFEGHPLLKDYPIERTQPLVPYRDVEDIAKLPPFGLDEGQPFARVDWKERLAGNDEQVSPSLGVDAGQLRNISDSQIAESEHSDMLQTLAGSPAPAPGEG